MENAMSLFLSEGALREHREYLSTLKHRASIYRKSGIDIYEAEKGRRTFGVVPFEEFCEIKELALEIKMHEIYFNSFGHTFIPCAKIKQRFGSENNFAFLIGRFAQKIKHGFVCVYSDKRYNVV